MTYSPASPEICQHIGSDIIKVLYEINGEADILAIMRQNSEESFGKMMDTVKMIEDMNIELDKQRCEVNSVPIGAANDDESVSNYECAHDSNFTARHIGA